MIVTIGGGIRPRTDAIWQKIASIKKIGKLLYIPYARNLVDYSSCLDFMIREVRDDKCAVSRLPKESHFSLAEFRQYDAIYIGGGNVWEIAKYISEMEYSAILREYNNGGLIIGSSAGAIVFGKDARMYRDAPDGKQWISGEGLNLCNGLSFACHYITSGYYKSISKEEMDNQIKTYVDHTGNTVCALPEESALIFDDHGKILQSIGEVFFYSR